MEDRQNAKDIRQFNLQNPAVEDGTFSLTVGTSQVQLFPMVQPSQHNIDDDGQQPGQQTHSIRTLQGPSPHGEAFQETPDVKPHLLVDDRNEQDPDVGAFQLHPVVWPLQGQQNLSPPLALAQHNPAVQPSSQNAAVLQNPALSVSPGVVQNSVIQPDSADQPINMDTDVGTDWCRERVVTQNKRRPFATNSTEQTTGSDGTITVTDRGVLPLWRTIGEWNKLATDTDIARFLLSIYFKLRLAETQSDSRCVHCSTPLTMCCITCLLSAKQPAPSQSSSSGKSHLSQMSACNCAQSWDSKLQNPATSEDEMAADFLCGNDSEEDAEDCVNDVEIHKDTSWETQAKSQWNIFTTPVVPLRRCDSVSTSRQAIKVNKKVSFTACRPKKTQARRRGARSSTIPQETVATGSECSPNQSQTSGLEKDCAVAANKKRALDGRNVRNARLEAEPVPKKTRRQSVESLCHRGSARPGGETEDIASSDPLKGDLGSANNTASLKIKTESHSADSDGSLSVTEETESEKYPICDRIPFRNGDIPAFKHFSEYRCSRCDRTFKYKHLIKRHLKKTFCDTGDAAASCARPGGETEDIASSDPLKGDLGSANSTAFLQNETESHSTESDGSLPVSEQAEREESPVYDGPPLYGSARPGGETEDAASSDSQDDDLCSGNSTASLQIETESHSTGTNAMEEFAGKPKAKKKVAKNSDDEWKPSYKIGKAAPTKPRSKKFGRTWLNKEYTSEEFMTGMVPVPIGVAVKYKGASKTRVMSYSHYTCEHCYKVFVSPNTFQSHQQVHLKDKEEGTSQSHAEPERNGPDPGSLRILKEIKKRLLYCCPHCDQIFINNMQYRKHVRSHPKSVENKEDPTCHFCGGTFTKQKLKMHQRIPKEKRVCKLCGLHFKVRCEIRSHMRAHREKNCKVCGHCFDGLTKGGRQRHLDTHKAKPLQILCTVCGESVPENKLPEHMDFHNDPHGTPFSCSVCGLSYKTKGALCAHKHKHGEKKLQCETCGEHFHYPKQLKRHRITMHMRPRFDCKECGKQFFMKENVESHVLRVHRKVKPHVCSVCGHRVVSKATLKNHMRTHTGEKPYQCPHCPSRFAQCAYLILHVRTHTGEKPYGCEDCDQAFISCSGLTLHRRNRHSDKVFPCSECEETFPLQSSLDFHCYNEHGGDRPSNPKSTEQFSSAGVADVTQELIDAAMKSDQIS